MQTAFAAVDSKPHLTLQRLDDDTLLVSLAGNWKFNGHLPAAEEVVRHIEADHKVRQVVFDTSHLHGWDSALLTFLIKTIGYCSQKKIDVDQTGLPEGVRRLLALAAAVPERRGARRVARRQPFLSRIGAATVVWLRSTNDTLAFIGESCLALLKFVVGRASFRRSDLAALLQDSGAQALPIVSLISFLVGLILAFVGAVQLQMFGAQIYVANLVGIAVAREMAPMMVGIIMAGRTGAAFAAQLGTMQVNEEIDALRTLGISPMEFLILPRMLALVLMMPLLCLYADLVGILGGAVVGSGMLDLSLTQYYHQTKAALNITQFTVGIFKSGVFGIVIAMTGCLRGMQCGRSASEVGSAATSAVVTAIVVIIVLDGIFAVITNVMGV
ncbi:MAG: ABC transporter permease [Deltaproteobacteria bacterium]|nr:ABC transporter permease [Deltaproteobacteria bacterium]